MRRSTLATLCAAPLATLVLACGAGASSGGGDAAGTSKGATPVPVTVAVGQTLNLDTNILGSKTKVEVTLSKATANAKASNQFSKPNKGQFLVADVTATVTEGKTSVSHTAFKLVAADGTAYDPTMGLDGSDLSGNDLTQGQKTAGKVWFDIPKGAEKGGKIALTNWLASGDVGYWTL